MECPRCGFPQAESAECARCGIVFRKWQARESSVSDEPAVAQPAERPVSTARGAGFAVPAASAPGPAPSEPWFRIPRASVRDAAASLSRLLHAGLGMPEALRTLGTGAHPRLRACLVGIGADLEAGASLADAAARYPELFDATALQSLRTAERTGSVPMALDAIAARIDATLDTQRQVFRSAIYPLGVLATSILLGPIPELMTGSAGAYVAKVLGNLALVAAILFFFAVLLPRLLRTTRLGQDLRRAAWRLPWPASVYRLAVRGAFCRSFADQIEAGLPLYDALDSAAATTVDPFARQCAAEAGAMLSAGKTLSESIGMTGLIPAGELMVLIAGERAGTLVDSLRGLAIAYAERLARGIRGLLRALGFVMTIVIFAWVALGIIEAFGQVSRGTEDIFKMIEKEMPYDLR
ncbi:MAG: type II secretion system F family protein [Myxococcota bacterium]